MPTPHTIPDAHRFADAARLCIIHDDAPGSEGYGVQLLNDYGDDMRMVATGIGATLPDALRALADALDDPAVVRVEW